MNSNVRSAFEEPKYMSSEPAALSMALTNNPPTTDLAHSELRPHTTVYDGPSQQLVLQ